jgi:hypothetical protein
MLALPATSTTFVELLLRLKRKIAASADPPSPQNFCVVRFSDAAARTRGHGSKKPIRVFAQTRTRSEV